MPKFNYSVPDGSYISIVSVVPVSRPGGIKFYVEGTCHSDDIENLPDNHNDVCNGSNMIVTDVSKIAVYNEKTDSWGYWGDNS